MKQQSFLPKIKLEHGGSLTIRKRINTRPLAVKKPLHLVLKSELGKGKRSLLRNKALVLRIQAKYAKRFQVRIYKNAVCGTHIHCLVKGHSRRGLQNFFRVFAGQVAQEILKLYPLQRNEARAFIGGVHHKNQKSFWSFLAYTRVVNWGRDFIGAKLYVKRNVLEALGFIPYERPAKRKRHPE